MAKKGFLRERKILDEFLSESRSYSYIDHALDQMRERQITRQDVVHVINNGEIVGVNLAHETEVRWNISGPDLDGSKLIVVIEAIVEGQNTVIVVTSFYPDG